MAVAWHVSNSALVVVDYQNDFCHEEGAVAKVGDAVAPAAALLPAIEDLLDAARAAGVPRIFVRVAHSDWTDAPAWTGRASGDHPFAVPVAREGTWGANFYGIAPRDDELVLTKHRYSAFLYTPLELVLQAKRASTLVIAGVQTDVCVQATARDAVQRGIVPVVVEDCVATRDQASHDQALEDIRLRMGHVVKLSDILNAWQ